MFVVQEAMCNCSVDPLESAYVTSRAALAVWYRAVGVCLASGSVVHRVIVCPEPAKPRAYSFAFPRLLSPPLYLSWPLGYLELDPLGLQVWGFRSWRQPAQKLQRLMALEQ